MSDLAQDDIDWIKQNVRVQVTVPEHWIPRATELMKFRQKNGAPSAIKNDYKFCSIFGEYYVGYYYPFLIDLNKVNWKSKVDLLHPNGKKGDVKTNNGYIYWNEELAYIALVNECNWDQYDFIIFNYYNWYTRDLMIVGWIEKSVFLEKAVIVPKGKPIIVKDTFKNNSISFNAHKDTYMVALEHIKSMEYLKEWL